MTYEPPRDPDGSLVWEQVQEDLEVLVRAFSEELHDGSLGNGFVLCYSSVAFPDDSGSTPGYSVDYYISKDCDLVRGAGILEIAVAQYRAHVVGPILRNGS